METMDTITNDTDAPLLAYENIDTSDFLASFKIDDNFRLIFSEKVMAGNGDIVISNGTDTRIVAIDDTSQVTFDELGGVTIDLAEDLVAGTTYQVQMSSGVIIDAEGNPFAGLDISGTQTKTSEPTFLFSNIQDGPILRNISNPLKFTEKFIINKDITAVFPGNFFDGSAFKTDDKIELNFDEKVIAGSGNIIISNDRETFTIPVTDTSQVIFDESENHEYGSVIIDPKNDLTADSTYTVQLGEGVITDAAGNSLKELENISLTTIGSDPLLLASDPVNGSQIKVDGEIKLFFDEKVIAGNGDIVFSNGTDTRIVLVSDTSQVSFDEFGGVTIDLSEDLIAGTTYQVQMANGAITDTNGNPFPGFSEGAFVSTTDSDPLLETFRPPTIFPDFTTELFFDEPVVAGSGDIVFSNATDTRVVPVNDTNQVNFDEFGGVIIKPHLSFIETEFLLFGSSAITDTEGNPFVVPQQTITSNPIVLASSPTNGSQIKVDGEIKLFFDEKVIAVSGDIVFSNGTDTRIVPISDTTQVSFDEFDGVAIDLSEDLIAGTTYQVEMASGVITDTTGNSYTGFKDAKISVINSAPLLLASNPANGSQVKVDGEIKLFFDEQVIAGSGDSVFSNGTDTRIVPVSDTNQVSFDEFGGVTIDLSENLIADTTYQVQMANGAITDVAGNAYTGFSNAVIETTESNPLLQSVGLIDDKIKLLFDEQIRPSNGDIIISNGTDTRIIAINDSSQVTFDERGGVTVGPKVNLSKNSVYSIKIENGAIVDTGDNPYTEALFNSSLIPLFEYISYEPVLGEELFGPTVIVS